MRYFLFLLALLGYHRVVFAQMAAPAGPTEAVHPLAPTPDTAAAIHRLFAAKRKRQVIISGVTFGAAVGAVAAVAISSPPAGGSGGGSSGYGSLTSGPILDGPAVAVLAVGIIASWYWLRRCYLAAGKKQEQQTIDAWQQHKEARFLKRKLKPKYFALLPPSK